MVPHPVLVSERGVAGDRNRVFNFLTNFVMAVLKFKRINTGGVVSVVISINFQA